MQLQDDFNEELRDSLLNILENQNRLREEAQRAERTQSFTLVILGTIGIWYFVIAVIFLLVSLFANKIRKYFRW